MKYGFLKRPKSRNWRNSHAKGRKRGVARSTRHERELEAATPRRGKRRGDYLFANCVVLAAAIFGERWAKSWAEDLLPAARQLDARRAAQ